MEQATPDMPVAATGVYVATGATNAFAFDAVQQLFQLYMEWLPPSHSNLSIKVLLIGADKMSSLCIIQTDLLV
jgi:3-oxoacyl-[acyl-carrier-protein] synthase-3